jgi:putative two-component system response regulator
MASEEEYLNSKILIVDDSDDNVNLLESILLDAGYQNIRSTMDSREAANIYKEMTPDLVLLDLNMPHLNGIQVLGQLNEIEQGSYLSVMVLTAQNDQETKIEALNAGAQDFLSKPFNFLEVNLRIKKMLQIKALTNQTKQQNENLEKIVYERTKELQETRMETIYRLGRAAEFRDNETGLHVVRMSRISAKLAQEIGLEKEECELILHASPMHDIGKIGIPDNILLKPGKLDHDEWKVMQTHSSIGAQILSRGRHKGISKNRIKS